jgi:hypothetical protein
MSFLCDFAYFVVSYRDVRGRAIVPSVYRWWQGHWKKESAVYTFSIDTHRRP